MSLLFESIKVLNRKLFNVEYHNARLNNSRKVLFGYESDLNLTELISIPGNLSNELYKCRVVYSEKIISVEFQKYKKKTIGTLQIIHDDDISYSHKYEDRNIFKYHLSKTKADEILIIKHGFVTDTSFSNVVFFDGTKYFTPSTPLLHGTKRAKLISEDIIQEEEIRLNDLLKFNHVYLVNAFWDLDERNRIPVEKIIF